MAGMADLFTQLEAYDNLDPSIIRTTKIHKVLKAIVKLASVPKDDEYNFKKRSSAILEVWNKLMEDSGETVPESAIEPKSAVDEKALEANIETNHENAAANSVGENGKKMVVQYTNDGPQQVENDAVENADEIEQKLEDNKDVVDGPHEASTSAGIPSEITDAKEAAESDEKTAPVPDTTTL